MLCCVCNQKEAKVHLTKVDGDKVQKVDLCEDCAKAKGIDDPAGFALADLLLGIGASKEFEQASGGADLRCPRCGFTQADFKKSGRLGCAYCYTTFADGLEGLLKSMHKGPKHIGKVPASLQQSQDLSEKLKSLHKKLAKAIEEEHFEQAAVLRDEIQKINSRLSPPEATPAQ
jgi:protein arginine kinase activator